MRTEAEFRQALRDWVIKISGKVAAEQLTDETPIIEQRVISSLRVMDLILYLEKLTGKPVDIKQLKAGTFRNINTITQNFFEETPTNA